MSHRPQNTQPAITARQAARYWRASMARDRSADGKFILAVRTTRIYCRPSCPARRPLRSNVVFYRNSSEAEHQGYRACLRCKPKEIQAAQALVQRAIDRLRQSDDGTMRVEHLAKSLGTTRDKLQRAVRQSTGIAPRDLIEALRVKRFKHLLRAGKKTSDALYDSGYGSPSRLYERSDAILGMTPATYQKRGKGMIITYSFAATTLGRILIGSTERGICAVYLGDTDRELLTDLRIEYPRADLVPASTPYRDWVREIVRRAEGHAPSLELPLDLQATAFQRRVWQELQAIPRGTTQTYTQIAQAIGKPSAARAVARACATNPVSIVVPCHRVIRGSGALAGYRWGLARKEQLLKQERSAPEVGN